MLAFIALTLHCWGLIVYLIASSLSGIFLLKSETIGLPRFHLVISRTRLIIIYWAFGTRHWIASLVFTSTAYPLPFDRALRGMASGPPKAKFRGKRGGDPNRRSQRQRHDRGLVSHLDFFDPENFESDRRQQQRREDRSRSAKASGAVAKAVESGAIEPTPPRRETSEVRRFPARSSRPKESTITSTSSVAVPVARPIAPPPVPSTEEEGAWQLSWVWIPSSGNPPSSQRQGLLLSHRRRRHQLSLQRLLRDRQRGDRGRRWEEGSRSQPLAAEAAAIAEALEAAEATALAESAAALAPAEPKVSAKKAKSPRQRGHPRSLLRCLHLRIRPGLPSPLQRVHLRALWPHLQLEYQQLWSRRRLQDLSHRRRRSRQPRRVPWHPERCSSRRPRWSLRRSRSQLCLRRKATQFLCWAVAVRQIPQGLLNARCWALIGIAQSPTNATGPVGVRRLFLQPHLLEFKSWLREGTTSVSSHLRR